MKNDFSFRLESNWSKLVYTFLRAAFLYQVDHVANASEIEALMRYDN